MKLAYLPVASNPAALDVFLARDAGPHHVGYVELEDGVFKFRPNDAGADIGFMEAHSETSAATAVSVGRPL